MAIIGMSVKISVIFDWNISVTQLARAVFLLTASKLRILKQRKMNYPIFYLGTMIKFPKFSNLQNLWNLEKLSNTLNFQVI